MEEVWTKYRKSMEKEWKKREGIKLLYVLIINYLLCSLHAKFQILYFAKTLNCFFRFNQTTNHKLQITNSFVTGKPLPLYIKTRKPSGSLGKNIFGHFYTKVLQLKPTYIFSTISSGPHREEWGVEPARRGGG